MEVKIENLVTLRRYAFITGMSYWTLRSWVDHKDVKWVELHGSKYGCHVQGGVSLIKIGGKPFVDVNQSRLDEKYVK